MRLPTRRRFLVVMGAVLLGLMVAVPASIRATVNAHASTLLYSDDFESDAVGAQPAGWTTVSGTWSVAVDGTHVMKETNTNTATAKSIKGGSASWTDYALQAQIKPGTTAVGTSNVLSARYTDDNNTYALILKDGSAWYFGKKVNGVWTTLAYGQFTYNTSTWYQLEVDVSGTALYAYINGQKIAGVTDSTFASGGINVMSRYLLEVDNVTVTAINPPPPPSPSPSPSPTPSPSPVPSGLPSTIAGVVVDAASGAPLAGVQVSTQPSTLTATTDGTGAYSLALSTGTYSVLFTAPGYDADFAAGIAAPPNGTVTVNQTLRQVPALAAQDLFSRPDQAGLGTASDGRGWANDLNVYPTGTAGIAGRTASVKTLTANTDFDTWMGIPYRDQEVTADMDMVAVLQDPNFQHGGRLLARVQGSDSWLVLALNPSNDTLTVWVDASGNWSQIGSASLVLHPNVWYHAKLDAIGGSVYGKAWAFGSAEPAWLVTGSQSAITAPGVGGLRGAAADVSFANFTESPITQIAGKLTDAHTGAALSGVTVSLSSGATTTTGANGAYVFGSLAAGTYTVSSAPAGHTPGSISATVGIGLSATANLALS